MLNFNLVCQVRVFRKKIAFTKACRYNSKLYDPNIRKVGLPCFEWPDFWMVWRCHGILCIYVHFSIFLFRSNVRRGYLDESDFRHCFGNFFESAVPKVSWSQLFFLNIYEITLTTAFSKLSYSWRFYGHESRYMLIRSSRLE